MNSYNDLDSYIEVFSDNYETIIQENAFNTIINGIRQILHNIVELVRKIRNWIIEKFNSAFKKDKALMDAVDQQIKVDNASTPTSATTIPQDVNQSSIKNDNKLATSSNIKEPAKVIEDVPKTQPTKNDYDEIIINWLFATDESRNKAFEWMPSFNKTIGAIPQEKAEKSADDISKEVRSIYFVKEGGEIKASEVGGLAGIKNKANAFGKTIKSVDKQLKNIENNVNAVLKEYDDKLNKNKNVTRDEHDIVKEERYKDITNYCTKYRDLFKKFSPKYYGCYLSEYKCYKAAMTKCVAAGKTKNESVINKCVLTALYEADMCFA